VRLITASFLTKTLYLDWRIGARHFRTARDKNR
jgi:deoxyribodipyrimidine photo-lyase